MLIILYLFDKLYLDQIGLSEILLIFLIFLIGYIRGFLLQYVFRNDKISKILPYQNISKIFTIIIGFFIFSDTSVITLLFAILTAFVIFIFSFDFRKIYIPKTIKTYSIAEVMYSANILLLGYILSKITSISYFIYSYLLAIFIILTIVLIKKQLSEFIIVDKKFYFYRLLASHIGGVSYILSLFVMQELGIIISILISYLGFGFMLFFSFMFFGDKPSKKDLFLLILVSVLITMGYYFK